jgi:NhaP-type Na+/H+ or K+/H+ antiporter
MKRTRVRRQMTIITTYAISTVLGGALITGGLVAALVGLRLYGALGLLPGLLLGGTGLLLLNARDRWSGHHP